MSHLSHYFENKLKVQTISQRRNFLVSYTD